MGQLISIETPSVGDTLPFIVKDCVNGTLIYDEDGYLRWRQSLDDGAVIADFLCIPDSLNITKMTVVE